MADDNNHEPEDQLIRRATAIQTAKAIRMHLGDVRTVSADELEQRRLALDSLTEETRQARDHALSVLEDSRQIRDSLIKLQRSMAETLEAMVESQGETLSAVMNAVAQIAETISSPSIEIPKTRVTLQQQPVTVNVPKSEISLRQPVNVTVPKESLRVENIHPEMPTKATINHSDGTASTVEFR